MVKPRIWKFPFRVGIAIAIGILATCVGRPLKTEKEILPYAQELQQAIERVILANQSQQPVGISAAVIMPGYQPWTGVSGYSYSGVPITVDMLFDAGSIAKNFEAALALKLVEDGSLNLDDPISNYLPQLNNVDRNITIRQLLNHTSGLFNVFEHPDFPWVGAEVDYSKSWGLEEAFDSFVLEPYGPPGEAQHYASTNYLLMTSILAQVSGAPVSTGIHRSFLRPLKLNHTLISMGEPPATHFAVAHPWADIDQDGTLDDLYGIDLTWKVSLTHPVLFSTARDLAEWMQALFNEQSVLEDGSVKEMLSYPEVSVRDPEGGIYGLGVVDFSSQLGVPVIGHAGSSLGYSAAALYLPETGMSMAWLVNTGESPPELADRIMFDAWSSLYEVVSASQASKQ